MLGRYRRRPAERGIVEHLEILGDGAACCVGRKTFFSRHRTLPVNIGADQAGIDHEALGTDQPFGHAALDGQLEQLA